MDPALVGVVLDSGVLIAAERRNQTPAQVVESVQRSVGEVAIVLSARTVAEIGHGIYRAGTAEIRCWTTYPAGGLGAVGPGAERASACARYGSAAEA